MAQATVQNAQQKINDMISENTALRERVKRMEEAVQPLFNLADDYRGEGGAYIVKLVRAAQAALKEGE